MAELWTRRRFLQAAGGLLAAAAGLDGLDATRASGPAPGSSALPRPPLPFPAPSPAARSPAGKWLLGKPVVAVVRASSYRPEEVRAAVAEAVELVGGLADVVRPGARVGIKVNLTQPQHPAETGVTTSPAVVEALVQELYRAGAAEVWIVEGLFRPDAYRLCGFAEVAERTGARLLDSDRPDPPRKFLYVSTRSRLVYPALAFHPAYVSFDVLVSAAKLKCHEVAGVTLSLKNLFGAVPLSLYRDRASFRNQLHEPAPWSRVPLVILDLNTAFPIHLSLIDGIVGLERGAGTWNPAVRPVPSRVLILGKNAVAADAVGTALMGFDPQAQYPRPPFVNGESHLQLAQAWGLGPLDLAEIQLRVGSGVQRFEQLVVPYRPPARDGRVPATFVPGLIS
ncbi:MAG: DUF362 domain-containing protein [Bacillota bacterium]|nr:DUF362 domain-containing protein [Bacillota bacterium]